MKESPPEPDENEEITEETTTRTVSTNGRPHNYQTRPSQMQASRAAK